MEKNFFYQDFFSLFQHSLQIQVLHSVLKIRKTSEECFLEIMSRIIPECLIIVLQHSSRNHRIHFCTRLRRSFWPPVLLIWDIRIIHLPLYDYRVRKSEEKIYVVYCVFQRLQTNRVLKCRQHRCQREIMHIRHEKILFNKKKTE